MDHHYRYGTLTRADDNDDGTLRVVFANEGKMGDGLDLKMEGVRLDRYRANPVVGYGHNYWGRNGLPIGRAESVEVADGRLEGDIRFDPDDEFAAAVDRKYRAGYLNAFSIGFEVHAKPDDDGVVDDWELYELSAVPIPMDPDAIVAAGRAAAASTAVDLRSLADQVEARLAHPSSIGRTTGDRTIELDIVDLDALLGLKEIRGALLGELRRQLTAASTNPDRSLTVDEEIRAALAKYATGLTAELQIDGSPRTDPPAGTNEVRADHAAALVAALDQEVETS